MQRKPGFPVANCNIKMPDSTPVSDGMLEEEEPLQRRQQLINFGHSQWGFNNWSWAVTKQDLDFAEITNGKYCAGVVSFVSVTVKSLDIHRENIGYATAQAPYKGAAIHNARKCAVTNALRETLLSFGGKVTIELMELLDAHRHDVPNQNQNQNKNQNQNQNQNQSQNQNQGQHQNLIQNQKHIPPDSIHENNQNIANMNKHVEKIVLNVKKEEVPGGVKVPIAPLKNVPNPPVAKTHPMPSNLPANMPVNRPLPTANVNAKVQRHPAPPPAPQPAPILRPNSNEVKLEDLSEEDARAERKRRQRQAQEEFRLKQLMKQSDIDDNQEVNKNSSLDTLLMAIPSQDIVIEETGNTALAGNYAGKRKSPSSDVGACKRRSVINKLDIIAK